MSGTLTDLSTHVDGCGSWGGGRRGFGSLGTRPVEYATFGCRLWTNQGFDKDSIVSYHDGGTGDYLCACAGSTGTVATTL